jgi:hypothetical protein
MIVPTIYLKEPLPNAYYKAHEDHLFIRRLGVDISSAPPSMKAILADVAHRHELTVADLKGPARARWASRPRQEAMWLMKQAGRFSLTQIGSYLGGRDHTAVLHGISMHEERVTGVTPEALKGRRASRLAYEGKRARTP